MRRCRALSCAVFAAASELAFSTGYAGSGVVAPAVYAAWNGPYTAQHEPPLEPSYTSARHWAGNLRSWQVDPKSGWSGAQARASPRPGGPWYVSSSPGKCPVAHVGREGGDRLGSDAAYVCVLADELGRPLCGQAQQVVEHQHLAVAGRTGADADGRHVERFGHRRTHDVGHALDHEREAAGRREGLGRVEEGRRRVRALPLDPEPAHGEDRLRSQAEVAHDGDLRPHDGLDHRDAGAPALELDGVGAGTDQRRGVAHGLFGGEVVAHPGHVSEDEAVGFRPGHGRGVMGHDVDVDVQRVWVAQDGIGDRVAHQDDVGAGVRDDASARCIVGRDHHDRRGAVAPFARPQRGDGDGPLAHRAGAAFFGRDLPPPAGYLRMRWCQAQAGQTSTS